MDLEKKLKHIIELHTIMRNAYFYDSLIEDTELYEKAHSCITHFNYKDMNYVVVQKTECLSDRVRYTVKYFCEDVCIKKDIRFIKGILAEINGMK